MLSNQPQAQGRVVDPARRRQNKYSVLFSCPSPVRRKPTILLTAREWRLCLIEKDVENFLSLFCGLFQTWLRDLTWLSSIEMFQTEMSCSQNVDSDDLRVRLIVVGLLEWRIDGGTESQDQRKIQKPA
jgi:hypothetical protein